MPTTTTQPSDNLTNPYGYSEMDWAAQLDPAYAAARAEVRRLSVGEGPPAWTAAPRIRAARGRGVTP